MPSVFDVLGTDHQEVKRMLAQLEKGPTVMTGASDNHLMLRKKLVEQLIIEESRHEALEEMYFWPVVRDRLPGGDRLGDKIAAGQRTAPARPHPNTSPSAGVLKGAGPVVGAADRLRDTATGRGRD